jgi:hypothetical protein
LSQPTPYNNFSTAPHNYFSRSHNSTKQDLRITLGKEPIKEMKNPTNIAEELVE